jgi:hypothetical protein
MNKVTKWVGIFNLILIFFYIITQLFFDLSTEINYVLISFTLGVTFFVLFVILFVFIKNILIRRKSKNKKLNYEVTKTIYIVGVVLSIIVIILAFNFSLYIQALLGNDLFLSLELDKEIFSLKNGESFSVEVDSGIITNLFCSANCNITLSDLSSGKILSSEKTHIFVSTPFSLEYEIFVNESYSGQKLYRVDLECISEETLFCYTSTNYSKHASRVISVEHSLNEEQNKSLEELKIKISSIIKEYNQLSSDLNVINQSLNNSFLDLSKFGNQLNSLSSQLEKDNLSFLLVLFNQQNFSLLESSLEKKSLHLNELKKDFSKLNTSITSEIYLYNKLIDNLTSIREDFFIFSSFSLDNSSIILLENALGKFNFLTLSFNQFSKLEDKNTLFNEIVLLKENLILSNFSQGSFKTDKTLIEINASYLSFYFTPINFSLAFNDPSSICCLFGSCGVCLNESDSSINYPIILLHGHSFNEKVSALASLEIFNSLQKELEKDKYLDVGSFFYLDYNNDSRGILGKVNKSVTIKASYYFDVLSNESGSSLLETKTDNIDTYSIRLKEIIDNVKYLTGKDKVIIVTHSMGGLVARRYVQVFGEDNVDKLILVTAPNHGVDGFVINYCTLFGTEDECEDMNKNSLFLNKLNRQTSLNIPVYNLVGEGCFWENSNGDGIVKNDSAYLSFAKNYYVNGTCSGLTYFHSEVLKLEQYPEVYRIINESLSD